MHTSVIIMFLVSLKIYGYNTHYNVYANTFYYEKMIPWESDLSNEMVVKVTSSLPCEQSPAFT